VRCGPGGEVKVEEGPPERVTFSVKMVCKTVRGWTLGWSLPIYNFDEYTPPPPLLGDVTDWKKLLENQWFSLR